MTKLKIDRNAFSFPMPVVLVGSNVNKEPNFQAVAWVTRVNYEPPMIAISLGNDHYTNIGILENKTFSVNIPGEKLVKQTDYCGIVSGHKVDKSTVFDVFYGELKTAPMIKECPAAMECILIDTVELKGDMLFIGEVIAIYSEKKYLKGGFPDIKKVKPFLLSSPDSYYSVGRKVAKAWDAGKRLNRK